MEEMQRGKKIIRILLSVCVLILLIKVCWKIGLQDQILGETIENRMEEIPSFVNYEVASGESITQTFVPTYGYITQIRMLFLQVGENHDGNLKIQLSSENGKNFWNTDIAISDLKAGEWMPIIVESHVKANSICKLTFQAEDNTEPVVFVLANRSFDTEENQILYDNDGQEVAGGMLVTFDYKMTLGKTTKLIYCLIAIIITCILLLHINIENPREIIKSLYNSDGKIKVVCYIPIALFLVGLFYFTHLYRLFDTPYGLNIDEAGMGFDAWTLANWGTDRYLIRYPVYLINFGGGQSAMHAYIVAVLIKIFGYSEKLFRMPAIINAIEMLIAGSLLIKKRWEKNSVVILFMGLFMIFPVFIMFTRFGFDCNLMMGMSTILLLVLVQAVTKEHIGWYVFAGIIGGVTLYTYVISYLILPIFFSVLFVYLLWNKKVKWKQMIAFALPLGIIALPLILVQLVNLFDWKELHLGIITIPRMLNYRSKELSIDHYWSNLYDTLKCTFWNDMWNYDSIPEYKMMYWFTVPFAIIGLCQAALNTYKSIREKVFHIDTVVFFYFCCVFFTGGLLDGGSGLTCYKINSIYIPVLYFVVQGIVITYRAMKNEAWLPAAILILFTCYGISFGQFTDFYYGKEYHDAMIPSVFFDHTYKDTITEVQRLGLEDSDREICVEAERSNRIYFYASKMIPPTEQVFDKEIENYHNYYFTSKDNLTVNPTKVYILNANSKSFAMELERNGMIVNKIGETYLCY